MSYQVTLNPGACHEVHLGVLRKPPEIPHLSAGAVTAIECHLEIRSAGETELYFAAACQWGSSHSHLTQEKYAVNLSRPDKVRRMYEQTWQSATPLWWGGLGGIPPRHPADRGISYKGLLFEKSGPRWSGVGSGPFDAKDSQNGSKISVSSWDGFDITYDYADPAAAFQQDKVKGRFWTDIYDTRSGERLIQVQGSFDGARPTAFLGEAAWYGTHYYVMPVGSTSWPGAYNLRRLLICDADAAARMHGSGLKERK
jgi:hypothetical protein